MLLLVLLAVFPIVGDFDMNSLSNDFIYLDSKKFHQYEKTYLIIVDLLS